MRRRDRVRATRFSALGLASGQTPRAVDRRQFDCDVGERCEGDRAGGEQEQQRAGADRRRHVPDVGQEPHHRVQHDRMQQVQRIADRAEPDDRLREDPWLPVTRQFIEGTSVFRSRPNESRPRLTDLEALAACPFPILILVLYLGLGIAVPAAVIASRGESGGAVGPLRAEQPTSQEEEGKVLFIQTCKSCHTLAAVNAHGVTGPNLDDLAPLDRQRVRNAIRRGGTGQGRMPSGLLQGQDAQDVAIYVSQVAGQ